MTQAPHSASALAPPVPAAGDIRWGQLYGSARALALAGLAREYAGLVLVIATDARDADRIESEVRFYAGDAVPVLQLPDWETLPYDGFSPYQDIISRRLECLHRLPRLDHALLVVPVATLMQRLAPREWVEGSSFMHAAGDRFDVDQARREFEAAGYNCVAQVGEHGEFAVRGALVDVYPMGSEHPYRIDLFDDEIESIRQFDADTQRSLAKLERVELLPAREFPLDEEAIRRFRHQFRRRFEGDPTRAQVYREVSDGRAPGGIEYFLPLFFETTGTLFDYLPERRLVVEMEGAANAGAVFWASVEDRHEQRAHDLERPILTPAELYLAPDELEKALAPAARIHCGAFEIEEAAATQEACNFATAAPPRLLLDVRAEEPAGALLAFLEEFDGRVLFAAESAGRRETLLQILRGRGLHAPVMDGWAAFADSKERAAITVAPIQQGLLLQDAGIAVIAEEQLFGERVRRRTRARADRDPESIIRDLADLREGAPVVHESYGIGRYEGLRMLQLGTTEGEFLTLSYAGGDLLYVPVHALHLITRYTGASPESAPLHRLGSDQWKKARSRAAARIHDVAVELLDLYARRAARSGHACKVDERDYLAFAAGFPFDETEDQAQAIEQVVADLRAPRPMDRVVCGDVGFGKTEVAMRAAFVAVQSGRQVAVLVPTTLLAQQHFQNFSDRFADWPIQVEVLSRFGTTAATKAIIEGLGNGRVDIVIGTHKLLQGKIQFADLGLVVIDEEHRFGVRHKEKLRNLRAEVDLLTLTATPIPRTLNMAMGGLREMSLITTPPAERLAVKTFVTEWNPVLLRDACLRELKRGGQIFLVHNKVANIEHIAAEARTLVPEASIRVAHGQMRERDLEQVMLDFYHRRFDMLVCTTIIESGIDIPTANTIIINRADHFGLAQLHQLRGRVGRSHHRAYAYLVAPPTRLLTPDAQKRLEAIESLEDLGAGFTLATHDLEIRGAGELLGAEQSGQIHEIGFALYTELLSRAVAALRDGRMPELERPLDHGPEVELHIPALLPESYIPDVHTRLMLYKRIASAADDEALRELQVEMIDRFGLLPDPGKTLFRVTALKLRALPLGIARIEASPAGGRVAFAEGTSVDATAIVALVHENSRCYSLDGPSALRFRVDLADEEERFSFVERLLGRLAPPTPRAAQALADG